MPLPSSPFEALCGRGKAQRDPHFEEQADPGDDPSDASTGFGDQARNSEVCAVVCDRTRS